MNRLAILTPTMDDFKRVQKYLFSEGYQWGGGSVDNSSVWNQLKEQTGIIVCPQSKLLGFSYKSWFVTEEIKMFTFASFRYVFEGMDDAILPRRIKIRKAS